MGLHFQGAIDEKKRAVDMAIESFVVKYKEGYFEDNSEEFLYHAIENLNSLVVELKSG